jgi:hypothetical protein
MLLESLTLKLLVEEGEAGQGFEQEGEGGEEGEVDDPPVDGVDPDPGTKALLMVVCEPELLFDCAVSLPGADGEPDGIDPNGDMPELEMPPRPYETVPVLTELLEALWLCCAPDPAEFEPPIFVELPVVDSIVERVEPVAGLDACSDDPPDAVEDCAPESPDVLPPKPVDAIPDPPTPAPVPLPLPPKLVDPDPVIVTVGGPNGPCGPVSLLGTGVVTIPRPTYVVLTGRTVADVSPSAPLITTSRPCICAKTTLLD